VATYESGLRKTFHMADMPAEARPRVTAGPGERVRFAVFAPDGRRSMAWTVGTTRRTRDVYVTARPLGGTWKMSLHQSGRWNSGLTAERAVAMAPPIPDRHWDQWQQPAEFAPGIRRSVELVFPDVELRGWPAGLTDDKPVTGHPCTRRRLRGLRRPDTNHDPAVVVSCRLVPPPSDTRQHVNRRS
jgi:hypothetical protein